MTILFGLSGGLGNMLFALPAIKALARFGPVDLYCEGDYEVSPLFSRCSYAKNVFPRAHKSPMKYDRRICADVAPIINGPWERCGWPRPADSNYHRPEWAQIKTRATHGDLTREDISDWICWKNEEPKKEVDVALIPCGKPGDEWSRKKWDGFHALALRMESEGRSVESFGMPGEIKEAGLLGWYRGQRQLADLPDGLARCRVAVSTDSGVGHLASSIGVPVVMLFTATSPVKGQPLGLHEIISRRLTCAPCQTTHRWRACLDWKCRSISVDDVLRSTLRLFSR